MTPDGADLRGRRRQGPRLHGRSTRINRSPRRSTSTSARSRQLWVDQQASSASRPTTRRRCLPHDSAAPRRRSYVSDTLDAKAVSEVRQADLGRRRGKVKIETRSGNTAKPGVGLERVASVDRQRSASSAAATEGGKIASPPGRYLQFRARRSRTTHARVRRVTAFYVPQNQADDGAPTSPSEMATVEKLPTLKDSAAKPRSPDHPREVEDRQHRRRRHDLPRSRRAATARRTGGPWSTSARRR